MNVVKQNYEFGNCFMIFDSIDSSFLSSISLILLFFVSDK